MSEPEYFLTRWSRRKRAATEQSGAQAATPAAEPVAGDDEASHVPAPSARSETSPPVIDPATLPPIETIGASSNISAFLRAGVPAEMTRAALRRAWASDPNIRDFVGLAENAWDFTAPDGVPGFGPLSAADASRVMAQLTGKARETIERIAASEEIPDKPPQVDLSPRESSLPQVNQSGGCKEIESREQDQPEQKPAAIADVSDSVQHNKENTAPQYNLSEPNYSSHPTRRAHGGALPE